MQDFDPESTAPPAHAQGSPPPSPGDLHHPEDLREALTLLAFLGERLETEATHALRAGGSPAALGAVLGLVRALQDAAARVC